MRSYQLVVARWRRKRGSLHVYICVLCVYILGDISPDAVHRTLPSKVISLILVINVTCVATLPSSPFTLSVSDPMAVLDAAHREEVTSTSDVDAKPAADAVPPVSFTELFRSVLTMSLSSTGGLLTSSRYSTPFELSLDALGAFCAVIAGTGQVYLPHFCA